MTPKQAELSVGMQRLEKPMTYGGLEVVPSRAVPGDEAYQFENKLYVGRLFRKQIRRLLAAPKLRELAAALSESNFPSRVDAMDGSRLYNASKHWGLDWDDTWTLFGRDTNSVSLAAHIRAFINDRTRTTGERKI